jgi:hypothetical protein
MSKELVKKIVTIQSKLKAPKSQYNKFGNYAYRNQEDILEAVKPLLATEGLMQTITDEIISVGNRVYVKATVTVSDGESFVTNSAFAREPQEQKGMNEAQITGSVSSYARKYALNGMYAIDDTKDADATNDHGKTAPPANKEPAGFASKEVPNGTTAKEAPKTETAKTGGRFAPKGAKQPPKDEAPKQDTPAAEGGWG